MTSTVILLNGVSSAGKSTLAKAIQLLADRHFLHVAMDDFIGMLPQGSEVEEAWFPVRRITHSDTILPRVSSGSDGENCSVPCGNLSVPWPNKGYRSSLMRFATRPRLMIIARE